MKRIRVRPPEHGNALRCGLLLAGVVVVLLLPAVAGADDGSDGPPKTDRASAWFDGSWQVGAFGRLESSPYRGVDDDYDATALPWVRFESERLRVGIDGIAATVVKSELADIELVGALRMEPFDNDDGPFLTGLEERDLAFEVGVAVQRDIWIGELRASYLTDANDAHDGHEIDLAYAVDRSVGRFLVGIEAGATWRSDKLNAYYAGVRSNEANAIRAAYEPGDAVLPYIGASVGYRISERLLLRLSGDVQWLPDEYTDSPIIDEDVIYGVGAAVIYRF